MGYTLTTYGILVVSDPLRLTGFLTIQNTLQLTGLLDLNDALWLSGILTRNDTLSILGFLKTGGFTFLHRVPYLLGFSLCPFGLL